MALELIMGLYTGLQAIEAAARIYDRFSRFSGIRIGDDASRALNSLPSNRRGSIEQISPNVFYDKSRVEAVNLDGHNPERNPREIHRMLDPISLATKSPILASQIGHTPQRLKDAFFTNPFQVLIDPRPLELATGPPSNDHIPIMFDYSGKQFLGWQMRGALPFLFNCEIEPGPVGPPPRTPLPLPLQPAPRVEVCGFIESFARAGKSKRLFHCGDGLPSRVIERINRSQFVPKSQFAVALFDHTVLLSRDSFTLFGPERLYHYGSHSRFVIDFSDLTTTRISTSFGDVRVGRNLIITHDHKQFVELLTGIRDLVRNQS